MPTRSKVRSRRLSPRRPARPKVEILEDRTLLSAAFWTGYGGNAQHTAQAPVAGQPLQTIVWQTPVDLDPQYDSDGELLIHYGEPAVTQANTLIVPVKTGATGGFEVEAVNGYTGATNWTVTSDYQLPTADWTPSFGPVMTPTGRVYFAGDGGTVYYFDNPDSTTAPVVHQLAFYGLSNYLANESGFNSTVYIDTPLTSDANGDIYFGFRVQGTAPAPLNATVDGLARIDPSGNGTYVLVNNMTGDSNINMDAMNSAPAVSADGSSVYFVAKDGVYSGYAYLVELNATTLATENEVFLRDPRNNGGAAVYDISTSSPVIAPDGTVLFGVMGNPYNGSRGFLLHYSADLSTEYTPGAFGWDDTPSIVPASMVPGYTGTSSWLIFTKYNNYVAAETGDTGGNGVNEVAILDPYASQPDDRNDAIPPNGTNDPSLSVMQEVMTVAGPTPDTDYTDEGYPDAVREWCINNAVVDPGTDSVYVNSEDGNLYRWDLASGDLTQTVRLTSGIGEAYTPTWIGPDGKVYAINDATIFAVGASNWDGYAGDPQHTALSNVPAQNLNQIEWSVNIDPTPSGEPIHYGSPLITPANTVIMPIRTGDDASQSPTTDTFGLQFINGANGSNMWTPTSGSTDLVTTDYVLPPYDWTPSFSPVLTPSIMWPGDTSATPRVYFAGAGGTIYYIENPDADTAPVVHQLAFYGLSNYEADESAYNSTVFVDTPITVDGQGDIYFGFEVTGTNPSGLQSGIARISRNGTGIWVSASQAAGGDSGVNFVNHNSAPVLSNNEETLYVGLTNSSNETYSWLVALNSTTLALLDTPGGSPEKVRLLDPRNGNGAEIIEESSAAPMVAPDGTVFFGVFANPYNGSRGFMLHFSANLQTEYTPGAFGWDDTASIVPASMVPGYTGTSSYLVFVKDNNYAGTNPAYDWGDGVNEVAIEDPYATAPDPNNDGDPSLQVMKTVMAIPGPTPDSDFTDEGFPNAVREWCINSAVVDPANDSIYVNSEDGNLYRWDLTTDSLSQAVTLTSGVGEAYTPTAIGPNGYVYAINDHVLFAVGGLPDGLSVTETSSADPYATYGQSVTFTADVTSSGTQPTGTVTFLDGTTVLGTATLSGGVATYSTSALPAGRDRIEAEYSGDGNYSPGNMTLMQAVMQTTDPTVVASPDPSLYGQSVTLTATVSPGGPTDNVPTGTVTFLDGTTVLGTATLNSSAQATFSTSALGVAVHDITVEYGGDTNFLPATSPTTDLPVESATTSTVTTSGTPTVYGQTVTFTAAVTATSPGAGIPTGTVTFLDGTTVLGTQTLDGTGHATFSTSTLAPGSHSITVSYGGDTLDATSTSSAITQTVTQDSTTTSEISSANPSVYGQSVTFTAIVNANGPGSGTPTGTVTFKDGTTTLGTGTLSGGVATFTTTTLAVGTHPVTANYGGDTNFTGSSSSAVSQVVTVDGSTTTVASSANPSVFGQSVTFTATVSADSPSSGTPTGTVTFMDGSTTLGTASLSGGSATYTTSALAVGTHPITVSYGGDSNFTSSSSSTLNQVVNKDSSTATVSSSVNPSDFGQSVTFTATVTANSPGSGTPTGTVTFLDGTTTLGTASLSGGSATYTTSALAVGSHSITVSYGGDGNFNGSTSSALTQTVDQDSTTSGVTSSVNPSVYGQSVTFTATVGANAPGSGTPTGTVTFLDGTTTLGTASLSGGTATFTTSTLTAGSHSITVSYGGSSSFGSSTSSALTQTVNQDGSTSSVASSANPSVYGQSVTFTATVTANSPGSGTPTGTVTFLDGTTTLGTASLSGGSATFTTSSLTVGSHSITVSYGGDGNFNGSTSSALTQTVNQDGSTSSVASSANPSVFGQSVTFTATVSANGPGAGTPTGTVTFLDGTTTLGTASLSGGSATYTTSALAVGSHSVTVSYGGDGNFSGSTSSALTQTVNVDPTTSTVSSSVNPSASGQSVTFTATVSANAPGSGTPAGMVTFLDGTTTLATVALSGGTATYTTSSLANGSHSITVSYGGSSSYGSSTSSVLTQSVGQDGTTTTLVSSANPSVYGQSVTFTATVHPDTSGLTPTGTVTFLDGTTTLGTGTLSGGVATFTTSTLAPGGHSITASYGGDTNFIASTSGVLTQTVNQDGSTSGVTSSANPSVYGQSVTFTATVSASSPGSGTPTGTVTFKDGTTTLGSAALSGGSATFTTSALAVGSHSITVSYGGSSDYGASSSGTLTQTVNQDATSTGVTSSANPSISGQSVTFTATVSASSPGAGTPTGTVTFKDGTTTLGTGSLSGGTATFSTSTLSTGSHSITAVYGGDGNFSGSTSAVLTQTVSSITSTTTTVTSSANPSVYMQSVTFTATVQPNTGSGTPTGTVTFKDGTTTLGTASLSGGSATYTTSNLAPGNHSITVSYGGDSSDEPSTSGVLTQVVSQDPASELVSASANPAVYGQSVTFTATVSSTAPGGGTPTGSVTFLDGTTTLATVNLSGGHATYATSSLAVGGHSITISYGGSTDYTAGTSPALDETVGQDATSTQLTATPNPAAPGQNVTFTATVSATAPGAGTPTGQVTFYNGGTALATVTLSGGTASYSTSGLATGSYPITASYSGDPNFLSSNSSVVTETVETGPTTTTVSASPNPSFAGFPVTITATVTPVPPLSGIPTGTVTFKNNGIITLATVNLNSNGQATYTTVFGGGNYIIYAYYNGSAGFSPSSGHVGIKVNGQGGGGGPDVEIAGMLPVRTFRQVLTAQDMAIDASIAVGQSIDGKVNGSANPSVVTTQSAATKNATDVTSAAIASLVQSGTSADLTDVAGTLAGSESGLAPAGPSSADVSNLDLLFADLGSEGAGGNGSTRNSSNA